MHQYFNLSSRIVFYAPNLNFSSVVCLENGIDERRCICSEWNFGNDQGIFIALIDPRSASNSSATHAIVISRSVHDATCGEIWKQLEFFSLKVFDRSID